MTKAEICAELDAMGVSYSAKATVPELKELLDGITNLGESVADLAAGDDFLNSIESASLAMPFQGGLFTGTPQLNSKGELYTRYVDSNGIECLSIRFESEDDGQVTYVQANLTTRKLGAIAHENSCSVAQLFDGRPVSFGVKVSNNGWTTIHTASFYSNEYSVANPNGQRVEQARLASRARRFVRG